MAVRYQWSKNPGTNHRTCDCLWGLYKGFHCICRRKEVDKINVFFKVSTAKILFLSSGCIVGVESICSCMMAPDAISVAAFNEALLVSKPRLFSRLIDCTAIKKIVIEIL